MRVACLASFPLTTAQDRAGTSRLVRGLAEPCKEPQYLILNKRSLSLREPCAVLTGHSCPPASNGRPCFKGGLVGVAALVLCATVVPTRREKRKKGRAAEAAEA